MSWILVALTLCAELQASPTSNPIQVSGLLGDSVQLKATIPPGFHVREAFWKSVTPVYEMLASSFKGTPETLYQSRFYGRCRLFGNFTLEVGPLGLEDAGTFLVLLVNATGEMKEQLFHLEVHEAASRPAIRVFSEERGPNVSAGICTLFLTCSVSGGSNISYSWTRPGGRDLARKEHVVFQNGQVLWLTVDVREETQELYTCTAANAVSQESVTVNVQKFCSKGPANKGFPSDYRDALLIIVPVTSLFVAGLCVFIRARRSPGKNTSYSVSEGEPVPV